MQLKPRTKHLLAGASLLLALSLFAGCASAGQTKSTSTTTAPASFANAQLLVQTDNLASKLSDKALRIVDARPAGDYAAGHIEGAISIPVEDTFNPTGPKQMAGPSDQLRRLFAERGIGTDTRVVVYDAGKETKAARVFWTLEYLGHDNVSVLDGGFKKWQKEGRQVSTTETKAAPADFTVNLKPQLNATKDDVLNVLNKPGVAIVDARSPEEYRGEDLRTKRGGRVPGAVNIDWRTLFTGDDAPVLKSPAELKKMYEDAGVTRDKDVYAY